MPLYHVTTLDTFKLDYLIDAKTPEDAEHLVLFWRGDAGVDEWNQVYNGQFVTNIKEITLDDPAIRDQHEAVHGARLIADYVLSVDSFAVTTSARRVEDVRAGLSSYDDAEAPAAASEVEGEPEQLSLPF